MSQNKFHNSSYKIRITVIKYDITKISHSYIFVQHKLVVL